MGSGTQASSGEDPTYIMRRGDDETRRLIRQAAFREPHMRQLFTDAGITEGMRVLDVGSGAGDVAFLAAEYVGPTGSVLGVDLDGGILRTARARAEAKGLDNVEFVEGDLRALEPGATFDAVVGRFVLMYLADPVEGLRAVQNHLRPGGTVAVLELNFGQESVLTYPPAPLWGEMWSWMCQTASRAGVEMHMGYRLRHVFQAAGLPAPETLLQARLVSAADPEACEYAADTIEGMLPLILKFGVATEDEVDITTLAERLQADGLAAGGVVKVSDVVSAYAHLAK